MHLHGRGRSRHQPDRRRPAGNGLLCGGVPAQSGRWLNFLEQTVSLPSYLRREVTTAGGQRQHTMSYASSWAKHAMEVLPDEGSGPVL